MRSRPAFGVYRTTDGGDSWEFSRHSEVDYSYALAVSPSDPDVVFSGSNPKPFQTSGMVRRSVDGGEAWDTVLELADTKGVTSVVIDSRRLDDRVRRGAQRRGGAAAGQP